MKTLAAVGCAVLLAVACGGDNPAGQASPSGDKVAQALKSEGATVNLFWPVNANFKAFVNNTLVPGFVQYIKKTYGVDATVNVLETAGGDSAFLKKLQANGNQGGFDIDVARTAPSAQLLSAVSSGLLEPLSPHTDIVTNLASVDAAGKQAFTSGGKVYGAPIYRPTMSLFYNSTLVKTPPTSLNEIQTWVKANPNKFTYEDPRSATGTGSGSMFLLTVMHAYGDASNPDSWSKGWDYLKSLQASAHPEPATGDQMVDLFQRGEITMMPYWNDAGLYAKSDLKIADMKNVLIKEGFPIRFTPFVVPAGATHKTAALLFTNYTLSPEIQKALAIQMHQIPSTNASELTSLPADTFGFPLAEINKTSFAAYNSQQSLDAIAKMNNSYPSMVLGR